MDIRWILTNKILHRHNLDPEWRVKKLFKKQHGSLFVDIGSNRGVYARLAKDRFNKVVTIDPNPKWKADYQIALSDHNGHEPFYIGDDQGSADSLVKNPHILGKNWENQSQYDVEVRTFDSLGLQADLIKIDVEEAEFQVLKGIQNLPPNKIIVELHDERREDELVKVLIEKGYNVSQIDDTHWIASL